MKKDVRMKKDGKKMRTRLRVRSKLSMKMIVIFSACGAAILILLITVLNLVDIRQSKAKGFEIRLAEEQVFINDMSLPSPRIMYQKNAGPNTVFMHRIKHSQELPADKHE